MKKKELTEIIARLVVEVLSEFNLNYQKIYKPKRRHIEKYRKSRFHPDEVDKRKSIQAVQQNNRKNDDKFRDADYQMAPNVRMFLNTTLEAIPKSETSTKILHGAPVNKSEAMALARTMMVLPGFPFQQPRKLMSLLILLAAENAKNVS